MDSVTTAKLMRGSIGMLGMQWLMCPSTNTKAHAAGMPDGLAAYAIGRLGVMGDCPVDDVIDAAYFLAPDYLRGQIEAGRAVMGPAQGASIYTRICQEWGEDHLDGYEGNARLCELAERIVASASPDGAALFVGWRDRPLPESLPARTMQLIQTMRELGFARHRAAVDASEMTPLDAIMSGPTGAWNARFFGWAEPYPDGEPMRESRKAIEVESNRRHGADFEGLAEEEREQFVELARGAGAHANKRLTPESSAALPS